jgi:hypothetical protein
VRAHGYEIVRRFTGKPSDLFCGVTNIHHRRDIFHSFLLELSLRAFFITGTPRQFVGTA